jgi:hypothetical protein
MRKYTIGARIVYFPICGHLPTKLGSQDSILQPVPPQPVIEHSHPHNLTTNPAACLSGEFDY